MATMSAEKYRPYPPVWMGSRQWPSRTITKPPVWCSVDLRDGNQSLIVPMGVEEKREMFDLLVETGFREVEVGFPSASQTEYDFLRLLIEKRLVPDDVVLQVLTQARPHLISRTFEALKGARRVILHLYNSTSALQRRVVFRMGRQAIIDLARRGADLVRKEGERMADIDITYQYSPESFTGTELDFAVEVCEEVMDIWEPRPDRKVIINLPATVEMATPNVYADQIEWFLGNVKNREAIILSVHPHNDRGTAVAATELALMAGADRVEGTLFGNGERTGNVDIVTLALNMFSQGLDPQLDFTDINRIIDLYERSTGMTVPQRHPYAGKLVYTAFSGSHQDAINKGMKAYAGGGSRYWEVPYLPIDPGDVGRTYDAIIRINSQSGKGGVAYILEKEHGLALPREMHPEVGALVQAVCDRRGGELAPEALREIFEREYLVQDPPVIVMKSCRVEEDRDNGQSVSTVRAVLLVHGREIHLDGSGNGPIDAFREGLNESLGATFNLLNYAEHALERGSRSKAVAYVRIEDDQHRPAWGVGIDTNIDIASFTSMLNAIYRIEKEREMGERGANREK